MKNKLQIILHCLPREIDEVERICNHLQRSSHLLNKDDEVILDFTLNISDKLTDWKNSKLPKEFFVEKWKMMEKRDIKRSQLRCEGCALLCEKLIAATGDGL